MKLYVKGASKKAVNEALANGQVVTGENFSFFGGAGIYKLDKDLPKGTVISIFDKYSGGQPVAKSYGTWDGAKLK
jgi:hypothetical protein